MPPSTSGPSIPLPVSLTASTQSLPSDTQEALISHLRETSSIPELSSLLSDSLARSGWTDRVRALSLELLRNGTCDTFPELMAEVMRRAKIPKSNTHTSSSTTTTSSTNNDRASTAATATANGTLTPNAQNGSAMNGAGSITVSKEWTSGPDGLPDIRIPETTVETGVDFLKDKIGGVVEIVDSEDDD